MNSHKIKKGTRVIVINFWQYVDRFGAEQVSLDAMIVNVDTAYSHRKYSQNYRERTIGDTMFCFTGFYLINSVEMDMIVNAYFDGKFVKHDTGDWQ